MDGIVCLLVQQVPGEMATGIVAPDAARVGFRPSYIRQAGLSACRHCPVGRDQPEAVQHAMGIRRTVIRGGRPGARARRSRAGNAATGAGGISAPSRSTILRARFARRRHHTSLTPPSGCGSAPPIFSTPHGNSGNFQMTQVSQVQGLALSKSVNKFTRLQGLSLCFP